MEYERRFRLDHLPTNLSGPSVLIRQVYWPLGDGWVLRLRRLGIDDSLDDEVAIKGPRRGMGRPEFEFPLRDSKSHPSESELRHAASELFRAGHGNQIVKTRHSYLDANGTTWDIDEFHFANQGLLIAEVEDSTPEFVAEIAFPSWAIEDVTSDARYNNEALAFRPYTEWPEVRQ